jgi:DNA-damage-inducible protein J
MRYNYFDSRQGGEGMARTAMIHARTDAGLKAETETILRSLGLSYTEAINLFLNQVRMRKGLPFAVEIPESVFMSVIERGRRRFLLKKSLRVRVGVEGGVWVYEYSPLEILAYGSTQEEARDAFTTEFASAWEQVGKEDDSNLTRDAKSLKKRLLSLVGRVEGA